MRLQAEDVSIVGREIDKETGTETNSTEYDHQADAAVNIDWQTLCRHPLTWAACIRFLCHDRVVHRVFVAPDTFLLSLCVEDREAYFVEVTASVSTEDAKPSAEGQERPVPEDGEIPMSASLPFIAMDFTTTLTAERENNGETVVLCFVFI